MIKIRKAKSDDQDKVQAAMRLIDKLVEQNPQIDNNQWVSACLSSVVSCFISNGFSYDMFQKEMQNIVKCYKEWWESNELE